MIEKWVMIGLLTIGIALNIILRVKAIMIEKDYGVLKAFWTLVVPVIKSIGLTVLIALVIWSYYELLQEVL